MPDNSSNHSGQEPEDRRDMPRTGRRHSFESMYSDGNERVVPAPSVLDRRWSIAAFGESSLRQLKKLAARNENRLPNTTLASSTAESLVTVLENADESELSSVQSQEESVQGDAVQTVTEVQEATPAVQADLPAAPVVLQLVLPVADWNRLRFLATFARLPRPLVNATRPLQLTRNGFFYIGGRRVRCFYCGATVQLLDESQHGRSSPQCLSDGPGHHDSETVLRRILSPVSTRLGVVVRQQEVNLRALNIDWR